MEQSITGTEDMELGALIVRDCQKITQIPGDSIVALFEGLEPQNILETMLISQMAAAHSHCLKQFKDAKDNTVQEVQAQRLKLAERLMRTFAQSMETLERTRRQGKQQVRVERVFINQGGQAIVGNVHKEGG